MMRRSYIGVDIGSDQLTAVAMQRGRPVARLLGVKRETVIGMVDTSSRRPNVTEPRRFVEALRRVIDPLAGREERLAVALPDRVGRIYLLDVETPFKSRQEGVDILKWRLKGQLPAPPQQVQLDYQVLERRDDGRIRCVVAALARPVLEQYEELIGAAGRHAVQVEFHSQSLYNYYRPRLDLGDEFLLLGVERSQLSVIGMAGRTLAYQRVREMAPEPELLFRELTRTLTEAAASFPPLGRCPVFAHLDPGVGEPVRDLLAAITEREVRVLDPHLKRFAGLVPAGLAPAGAVLAALGAAERLIIT
jgi:type IV pilus assembly protein PilM